MMRQTFEDIGLLMDQAHRVLDYWLNKKRPYPLQYVNIAYPSLSYTLDPEDGSRCWRLYFSLDREHSANLHDVEIELAVLLGVLYPEMPRILVYIGIESNSTSEEENEE